MVTFPGAVRKPSGIRHPMRSETRGIVIHWTAGHEAGDIATLDGPSVDCHFYVTRKGRIYQFLEPGSEAWHALRTANRTCIGIEHEGFGEAWTADQLDASARLSVWLTRMYNIPVRKVDPVPHSRESFCGLFGHRDLSLGGARVDGNDHTDTVPNGTGWQRYLDRINEMAPNGGDDDPEPPPHGGTLRLVIQPRGKPPKLWAGWEDASGALRWIADNGLAADTTAALAWRGRVTREPEAVTKKARELVKRPPDLRPTSRAINGRHRSYTPSDMMTAQARGAAGGRQA